MIGYSWLTMVRNDSFSSGSFLNEMVGQHPMEFPSAHLPFPGASGPTIQQFCVTVDWHIWSPFHYNTNDQRLVSDWFEHVWAIILYWSTYWPTDLWHSFCMIFHGPHHLGGDGTRSFIPCSPLWWAPLFGIASWHEPQLRSKLKHLRPKMTYPYSWPFPS